MNRLQLFIICATALLYYSCGTKESKDINDTTYIREIGYEYAARYRAIPPSAGDMARQDFLLDVKARESRIEYEVGAEYAREFHKAFADSAFTKQ